MDEAQDDDATEPPATGARALLGRVVDRADALLHRRPPLRCAADRVGRA